MGRITKDDHCLTMGLRTEKKWVVKHLLKEFPKNSRLSITHLPSHFLSDVLSFTFAFVTVMCCIME